MYKIMVVDDEPIIRKGIIGSLNWEQYGFSVIGEADNGKNALDRAKADKPDIILTDIYMPMMDGIDFSREIKKYLPDVIIIFLTGYNEFSYARAAIEIGIFRYLTKPVLQEDLIQVLTEVSGVLEHKEMERTHLERLKDLLRASLPVLKERFFIHLVQGILSDKEIRRKLDYLGLDIHADRYICMILVIDDFSLLAEKNTEDEMNLLKFCIENMTQELLCDNQFTVHTFEEKRNEIGVLCCMREREEKDPFLSLHQRLQNLQNQARQYMKTTLSAGIGRFQKRLAHAHKSYQEANLALEYRMAFGRNSIIFFEDMDHSNRFIPSQEVIRSINDLVLYAKSGNGKLAKKVLDTIFEQLIKDGLPQKDVIHLLGIEIVNRMIRIILEFGSEIGEVLGRDYSPFAVMSCETFPEVVNLLQETVMSTVAFVMGKQKAVSRNAIEKAQSYIMGHFMNKELKLAMIADSVHISPGYFSQLFKQVTGETCIEYLTKARINYAKKLLKETELKVYEIADRAGFRDSQYFSTCFKKYIGVSPLEYRDLISTDLI